MEIRKITEKDDHFAINNIYLTCWKTAYRGIVPQTFLDTLTDFKGMDFFDTADFATFVIVDNCRYIGTATAGNARDKKWQNWGEVISIYILPEFTGKGFGKLLMDSMINYLRDIGNRSVYLWVLAENLPARVFYEHYGFITTGESREFVIEKKNLVEVRYTFTISN